MFQCLTFWNKLPRFILVCGMLWISCDKVQFWFLDWMMERHILAREVTYVLPVKSFAIRTKILDRQEVFLITRLFPFEPLHAWIWTSERIQPQVLWLELLIFPVQRSPWIGLGLLDSILIWSHTLQHRTSKWLGSQDRASNMRAWHGLRDY